MGVGVGVGEGLRGITTFGGSLLSKVYGMIKSRPSFPVYRLCFQSYFFFLIVKSPNKAFHFLSV